MLYLLLKNFGTLNTSEPNILFQYLYLSYPCNNSSNKYPF